MTGNSTFTGNVTSNGTGSFKNLIATDSLKIGSNGDAIAQLNHGTKTVSVSVGGASMDTANATLSSQLQTVSVSIGGCATGSRLLVTPQNLPDGLVLTKAVCTGSGAASVSFTNYGTAAASGSVSFSYEVIR